MPTKIPNFLNNTNSPLGTAFANLHQALALAPSEADAQKSADNAVLSHWKMLGMQGMGTQLQNGFPVDTAAPVGTGAPAVSPVTPSVPMAVPQPGANAVSPIAAKIAQLAPQAQAQGPDPRDIVEGPSSPIAATVANLAPQPEAPAPKKSAVDMGQYTRNALFAGQKPEEAGGYLLLGDANTYGARDPRTTNATVGAGKSYDQTAEHFDIGQANDLRKNKDNNTQSGANNAATNATSRANNQANIQKDYGVASMHESGENSRAASKVDPDAVKYDVDYAENHGGVLPTAGRNPAQVNADKAALWADMQAKGKTGADLVAQGLGLTAKKAAATQAGRTQVSTQINEDTANGAAGILQNLLKKGAAAPTDITGLNDIYVWAKQHTNDPDTVNLLNGIGTYSSEYARVMTGTTSGTPSSDAARDEAAKRILKGYNEGTISSALGQLHLEMRKRSESQSHALNDLSGGTYGGVGATPGMGQWNDTPPAASGWTVEKVAH